MPNNMVNNDRRTKLFFKIVAGQLAVGLLVTAIALFVLAYAQGNRINFKRLKIIKTGLISIEYLPKDSAVFINGKQAKNAKSFARNLTPGRYYFKISKVNYTTWQLDTDIAPESVNVYEDVVLFKSAPEINVLTDARKISLLKSPTEVLVGAKDPNGLFSNDYELWVKDRVIARFSTIIKQAEWYPDNSHIVYQQSKEIRIIEKNGNNDTLLVTLSQDNLSRFALSSDGTELYYLDGTDYKVAKIR